MAQTARALVTKRLRVQNAKQFVESFDELGVLDSGLEYIANTQIKSLLSSTDIITQINGSIADSFYLFVGKLDRWTANDITESSSIVGDSRNVPFDPRGTNTPLTAISDTTVPNPADSFYQTDIINWDDMLLAKRIQRSDVSHVIPRITWESGKVYRNWDDRNRNIYNISDNNVGSTNDNDRDIDSHYIVTEDFNVFKCLNNNRGKITSVGAEPITEGSGFTGPDSTVSSTENQDNYVWKYLYTIGSQDAVKFITQTYIPVKTLHRDERDVANPASGNFEEVTTDTNQRTIERSLSIEVSAGRAQNILTAVPYDDNMYYEGHSFLYLHNSILSGAQFSATTDTLTANLTTSLRGGDFNGSWANGMLTYIGNNGALTKQYKIIGTESATGVITLSLDKNNGTTTFDDDVNFYDAGAGSDVFTGGDMNSYAILGPSVKINGDGTGAYAYAEAVDNRAGITFPDAYSTTSLTLDATVSSNWANGINLRLDPLSSLSTTITSIAIPETGIDAVKIFNSGTKYYHAEMEIASRVGDINVTPARFRPILNPRWGHGWDAVEELSGYNVMINSRLEGSGIRGSAFGAYTVDNDFRKIGIVKNPIAANISDYEQTAFTANGATDRAVTDLVDQSFRFAVPSIAGGGAQFMADDILRLATSANITIAYARVVDFPEYPSGTGPLGGTINDTDYHLLRVIPEFGYDGFYNFDWVATTMGFIAFTVIERSDPNVALAHPSYISRSSIAVGLPTLNPYTGEVLYVENRSPVSRSADQTEDLKIILQF